LTLQESKTEIISTGDYLARFNRTDEDAVRESLEEKFEVLVGELRSREFEKVEISEDGFISGPSIKFLSISPYMDISFNDLDEDQQAIVSSLNLWQVLEGQINSNSVLDLGITRFVLQRIFELKLVGDVQILFQNLDRLYPLFPHVLRAISAQAGDDPLLKVELGGRILKLLDDEVVGHLEYHRAWILAIFVDAGDWYHVDQIIPLWGQFFDSFTRCEIVAILGVAERFHWFRSRKADVLSMPPWERRSFLAGARCLPGDESAHWFRSLRPQLDMLERAVVDWVGSQ